MLNGSFRTGFVLAVAVLVAGVLGSPAQAQTKVRVGKAIGANFAFLGADVGIAAGIYKKHGLDLEIVDFNGAGKFQQGFAADAIDIGLGAGTDLAYMAKGTSTIAIGVAADQPRTIMLVVRKDGPIKTLEDLKGKTISCSTAGSLTSWLGQELSRQMGWGPDGIKIAPLGGMQAQTAALQTGQIDGMIVESTTAFKTEEAGLGKILVRFGDRYKHFHVHLIEARKEFVEKHPELVRAFLAGWLESVKYMFDNRDKTIAITQDSTHTSKSIAEKSYDELMPMYNRTGKFDPEALAILAKSFVDMQILPSAPDMSNLYTEKFLPETK